MAGSNKGPCFGTHDKCVFIVLLTRLDNTLPLVFVSSVFLLPTKIAAMFRILHPTNHKSRHFTLIAVMNNSTGSTA
jgi:hypothetical protein